MTTTPNGDRTTVTTRTATALGLALLLAPLAAACTSAADGSFDAGPAVPAPTCLAHQPERPGPRYTSGQGAEPRAVLEMMRYYTANGTKPFCDGAAPTAEDRRWAELYVELGGDRRYVSNGRE
ncbi:hypothetical protein [Kitasatospora sp. NPDC004289]